jgi:hypothetical protein
MRRTNLEAQRMMLQAFPEDLALPEAVSLASMDWLSNSCNSSVTPLASAGNACIGRDVHRDAA